MQPKPPRVGPQNKLGVDTEGAQVSDAGVGDSISGKRSDKSRISAEKGDGNRYIRFRSGKGNLKRAGQTLPEAQDSFRSETPHYFPKCHNASHGLIPLVLIRSTIFRILQLGTWIPNRRYVNSEHF